MATVLEDIISHINANTSGLNVVGGYLHETPDDIVAVMNPDPGLENLEVLGNTRGTITIERPIISIRSRAASNAFVTANTNAQTVYKAIHNTIDTTIDSTRYLSILAVQPPYTMGADENGRWIIGFQVQIYKEENV